MTDTWAAAKIQLKLTIAIALLRSVMVDGLEQDHYNSKVFDECKK